MVFYNSMNNPKYIVASILMLTIIGGLLALNPSIFAQAQSYDEDYYEGDTMYGYYDNLDNSKYSSDKNFDLISQASLESEKFAIKTAKFLLDGDIENALTAANNSTEAAETANDEADTIVEDATEEAAAAAAACSSANPSACEAAAAAAAAASAAACAAGSAAAAAAAAAGGAAAAAAAAAGGGADAGDEEEDD